MPFPLVPLSKATAEWSLSLSELSLVIFAVVVIVGSVGEHKARPQADPWRPASIRPPGWKPPGRNWPKIWKWVVIAGIIGELFGDGGVWVSSDALRAITDHETEALRSANLALETQIQPRHLTDDQKAAMVRSLKPFAGSNIVLAHLIHRLFSKANEAHKLCIVNNFRCAIPLLAGPRFRSYLSGAGG